MAPWGFRHLNQWGGRARFAPFLAGGQCLCLHIMDVETLQQKIAHKRRKNSQLQDLQRQEGGEEHIWDIGDKIQGTTGHHGAKAKACQRHCFYMCGVAQHAGDTPGRSRLVVYVPDDNYRNPLRETKHQ